MKKRIVHFNVSFVAHDQSAVVAQPGEGAFNFPSPFVTAQFSPVLGRRLDAIIAMRRDQFNATLFQALSQLIGVGRRVINQTLWLLFGAAMATRHRNRAQRFFDERDFVRRGRVQVVSQRNTLAVDHHHPLRALAPLGFPDARAPFLAGAKLPSAKFSLQSSSPFSSNSPRNARQIFSHTDSCSHRLSRRQQVLGLGYCAGKSLQRAPVFKTHKMPSRTSRLFLHGLPPRLLFGGSGTKGAIFSHCASVSNFLRWAIGLHLRPNYSRPQISKCYRFFCLFRLTLGYISRL
jgi:hypothetical protein